jgi:CheY-like chemotaxis protein
MWNLLSNAVKFTPANGNVDVMLRRVGSNVEIRVSDTGPGIDQAFMPHLFDRFTQADSSISRKHGGLGLGLSIVRHLVELHGGHVRAENRSSGTGAVFTVELPINAALRHGGREPSRRTRPRGFLQTKQRESRPPLAGICILVIDDDGDARELIRTILEGAGAEVTTADSVNDALSLLGVRQFNVIVSDIGMPGRDGYELVHELREGGHPLPAIALSAYAREEDRMKAIASGFERHLVKPINPNELVNAVISLVETEIA